MTPVVVAADPPEELEKAELRDAPILLAGSATAVLRGIVGFVTFLLAFEFRGGKDGLDVSLDGAAVGGATATARGLDITGDPAAPVWHFGIVLLAAGVGALTGAKIAPVLRQRLVEERMLQGVLLGLVGSSVFAALSAGLFGAMILSLVVAMGAAAGKLAFDALVQRDAPDANHGRSFARFEARFQIAWVIGAFIPAIIHLSLPLGSAIVAVAAGLALVSYLIGRPIGSLLGRPSLPGPSPPAGEPPSTSDDDTQAYELSEEDVPPPQPQPPAATDEWAESTGWDRDAEPWVSSVDGVEVHPDPTTAPRLGPRRGGVSLRSRGDRYVRARDRARRLRWVSGGRPDPGKRRARPSSPARSATPAAKALPRSYWARSSSRPRIRSTNRSLWSASTRRRRRASVIIE